MWFRRIFRPETGSTQTVTSGANRGRPEWQLSAQSLRQLNRLQLSASRFLRGEATGLRPSLRRRPAPEFWEHRLYVPGDDLRYVDWKASARQEHVFVKQGEDPKEATVYLLLDCSASMAWGDPPKRVTGQALAAALGYLALAHRDRLVVVPFAQQTAQRLGPIRGKGQAPALLNYLRLLPFEGQTDFAQSIHSFSRHVARGGLTLIISDLLEVVDLSSVLKSLPAPTWDVVVFHLLHPEELDPTLRGDVEMVDVETGEAANYDVDARAVQTYRQRLEAWQNDLEMACVENNAFYCLIPADWSLDREIIPYLRSVHVVRPL